MPNPVEALVRLNLELELEQVVGEVRLARLRQLQLIDILESFQANKDSGVGTKLIPKKDAILTPFTSF